MKVGKRLVASTSALALLLGGSNSNAAYKCQRERTSAQEVTHGGLLSDEHQSIGHRMR